MTTRRLFEENVKTQRFEAKVLSCTEEKGKYRIELDATAFFPEGGGQPGDQGELFPGLNENGEPVRVLDTREKAGAIYHVTDKAIPEGTEVLGRLNWDKRLRNMQNHSGEHILSGLIHAKYGYNNVGFHMGSDAVTLDLDGVIVPEELPEFERQVNEVIEKNVEIEILYPSREELEKIDYRSKKEIAGQVRIVRIGTYDTCACCGTHVEYTGEIRLVKLLGIQNYKGGVRISMLAGRDAIEDYEKKHAIDPGGNPSSFCEAGSGGQRNPEASGCQCGSEIQTHRFPAADRGGKGRCDSGRNQEDLLPGAKFPE